MLTHDPFSHTLIKSAWSTAISCTIQKSTLMVFQIFIENTKCYEHT